MNVHQHNYVTQLDRGLASEGDGLSTAAIAGIAVVGACGLVALIVASALFVRQKRRFSDQLSSQATELEKSRKAHQLAALAGDGLRLAIDEYRRGDAEKRELMKDFKERELWTPGDDQAVLVDNDKVRIMLAFQSFCRLMNFNIVFVFFCLLSFFCVLSLLVCMFFLYFVCLLSSPCLYVLSLPCLYVFFLCLVFWFLTALFGSLRCTCRRRACSSGWR